MVGQAKITIPADIANKLKERAKKAGFKNVDEYAASVLKKVIEKLESQEKGKTEAFSDDDEKKVKERLKSLGYLG